ncbi:MAG: geranylgeranylglycerol-phosphate geranylgeranyltransferase [Bacteroidales bacterium]
MIPEKFVSQLKWWFRLFRWGNLLIIALTMILVRYALIHPLLGKGIEFPLHQFDFFILVLSIVFIAAGGYVINDYFDLKIDRINKPDSLILGRHITLNQALAVHQVLSALAIIMGFYVGYKVGSIRIGGIQAIIVAVLWYYSYRYKRLLIWGNLVVAVISGTSILIVWLFEFFSLKQDVLAFGEAIPGFKFVNQFIFSYFIFSLLLSFAREIIKDITDIPGDKKYQCKNLPLNLGIIPAVWIANTLLIIIFLIIMLLQITFLPGFSKPLLIYSVILLDIPFVYLIYSLSKANENTDFQRHARFLKGLMLAGIVSMVFITL